MTPEMEARSLAVAQIFGRALAEAPRLSFNEARERLRDAGREAVAVAATENERAEVKRRAAESILMLACSRNESWSVVRASFEKVRALGFTDANRHVQDAALLARWCIDNRAHHDDALRELRSARVHAGRLRKDRELRTRLSEQVTEFEKLLGKE